MLKIHLKHYIRFCYCSSSHLLLFISSTFHTNMSQLTTTIHGEFLLMPEVSARMWMKTTLTPPVTSDPPLLRTCCPPDYNAECMAGDLHPCFPEPLLLSCQITSYKYSLVKFTARLLSNYVNVATWFTEVSSHLIMVILFQCGTHNIWKDYEEFLCRPKTSKCLSNRHELSVIIGHL